MKYGLISSKLKQGLLPSDNKQALISLSGVRLSSMCYNIRSEGFIFTNPNQDPNPGPLPNDDPTIRNTLWASQSLTAWCCSYGQMPDISRINELKAKVNIYNLHILLKQMKQHASSSAITYDGGITNQEALDTHYTDLKGKIEEHMQAIYSYDPRLLTAESFNSGEEFTANLQATLVQIQALALNNECSL